MELWIARDKGTNELWGFTHRPVLNIESGMYSCDFSLDNTSGYELPADFFPEVTFENSPQQIELKLVGNGISN